MKIVFIASKTSSLINFRGQLMKDIIAKGHEVVAIVPEDEFKQEFSKMGVKKIVLELNRSSLSVGQTLKYMFNLKKILEQEKPDKVFSYSIKPVIFGSIAAHLAGVKEIYSLVCGLGYVYSNNSFKNKILKIICNKAYKKALRYNEKIIFQNQDDIEEMVNNHLITREKTALVNGSGVDLNLFKKNKLTNNNSFIMVSRVIREKGIIEYFQAAKIIKKKYPNTKFTFIGAFDKSYKKDFLELKKYLDEKIVKYIPETNKVADYLKKQAIFVLPTYYREGIPKTLLEATAMGRPIITTYTPGCKETTIDGVNGYFVKPRDVDDLVAKMELMLNHKNLQKMGDESYKICRQKFDIKLINKEMLNIMQIK